MRVFLSYRSTFDVERFRWPVPPILLVLTRVEGLPGRPTNP